MTDPRMYYWLLVALLVGLVLGAWVVAMCVAASRNNKELRYGDGNKKDDRENSRLESVSQRKKPPQGPCRPYGKNDG